MKKDIHPEYREVLFHDASADKFFLIRSTLETTQTKEWEDGNTYPYYPLDISSASHPFYTGKQKIIDTGGSTSCVHKGVRTHLVAIPCRAPRLGKRPLLHTA